MDAFVHKGTCSLCGRLDYIVGRKEPFCLKCHIKIICPVPICRQVKGITGKWTAQQQRNGSVPSYKEEPFRKHLYDEETISFVWDAESDWPVEINNESV